MSWVTIGRIAEEYGVCTQTIRNWEDEGIFQVRRTKGGHRRFLLEDEENTAKTIIYSRVSSQDQKADLKRQTRELQNYCEKNQFRKIEVIEEIGSGMNYQKRGLRKLITMIEKGEILRVVISFKDRLMRFGSEILYQLCSLKQIEIVELHEEKQKGFEQQLVEDVITIMSVFCAKIYGRRSHRKRKKNQELQKNPQ
jgi:predicted site-specific integrase-resolvase